MHRLALHHPMDVVFREDRGEVRGLTGDLTWIHAEQHLVGPLVTEQVHHHVVARRGAGSFREHTVWDELCADLGVRVGDRLGGVLAEHVHRATDRHGFVREQGQVEAAASEAGVFVCRTRRALHALGIDLESHHQQARLDPTKRVGRIEGGGRDPSVPEIDERTSIEPQQGHFFVREKAIETPESAGSGLAPGGVSEGLFVGSVHADRINSGMDWSDLDAAQGEVINGHRLGERCDRVSCRSMRLEDRRSGRFWLLETTPELARELEQGVTASPDRRILPILASGVLDETHGYLITADVSGPTLDDLLEDGPLDFRRTVSILRQLAGAYRALHEEGVVLLDLRPRDILVEASWDEQLLIPSHPALVNQAVHRRMGGYCAPDVVFPNVDARADQFTLGVIGFELITGTTPHNPEAPPAERTMFPLSPFTGVPEGLATLITRLLSEDRERRYPSMTEVLLELERLAGLPDEPTYGHFTPVMPTTRREQPIYLADVEADEDLDHQDSILSFLLVLVVAWALAMALSVAIFWMW